ncbi:hypothetical protein BGW37DRAFT_424718 [Umbelopsis sp. PMI_123]|nr:hypothetical protein BGW37DRAFT_424718 [Umbelopsis sp. PMI_123]
MSKIRSRKQQNKQPLIKQIPRQAADDDISDTDKWRIIEQSGVLKNAATQSTANEVDQDSNTLDYVLQAVFLAFPFSFLFATFEVTVQVQYSEPWSYRQLGWRMLHVLPALIPLIYVTNRYKPTRVMQALMTISSVVVGAFLLYTVHKSPSMGQMLRAPGLATIWIYLIVQLDLTPAVITLAIVGVYYYYGLRKN